VVDCNKTETINDNDELDNSLSDNKLKTGNIHLFPEGDSEITIDKDEMVNLEARREIYIKQGFTAKAGSNFSATIDPCPETNNCDCKVWDKNTNSTNNKNALKSTEIGEKEDTRKQNSKNVNVKIYPNPTTNGNFNVASMTQADLSYSISIYYSTGTVVFTKHNVSRKSARYSLSEYSQGIYLVSLRYSNNKRHVFKLIYK
jgi:hypothetical protein